MLFLACFCAAPLGCGGPAKSTDRNPKEPEPEVKIEDLQVGTGPVAEKDDWVEVHYTVSLTDGTQLQSSVPEQIPPEFRLGRQAIRGFAGFEKGILGMKEGGKRRVTVPPELAYGRSAQRNRAGEIIIPANSTLIFEIDLMKVKKNTD
jgi:FKBP-type peptidyl-prolyl cis-trans isomerase FkpA